MKTKLTYADYQAAAKLLQCDVPTIRAVTEIESGGSGFDKSDRCIIRFEPHLFSRKTGGIYDKSHPQLSFTPWRPGYPAGVNQSWQLFQVATGLNANAAVQSTSWGLFQILGQHALTCDCDTIGEFVKRMETSEAEQLILFCHFVKNTGLDDELRGYQWALFARQYNGKQYAVNSYDTRLEAAYNRFRMAV